jgi:hypothetical protein
VRLQTLRQAVLGHTLGALDPTPILLAGVDASFDFDFNDYLHSRFLMRRTLNPLQLLATRKTPISFTFGSEPFSPLPVIIVFPFPEIGCDRTVYRRKTHPIRNSIFLGHTRNRMRGATHRVAHDFITAKSRPPNHAIHKIIPLTRQ